MTNRSTYVIILISSLVLLSSIAFGQKDQSKELRRLNAKIDRVRVLVDSLELDNQILLPELMSAFKQGVKSKAQQDSITVVILKRMNNLENRLSSLENRSNSRDSTNNIILNELVLLDNKIVTLTKSLTDAANVKSGSHSKQTAQYNDEQYKLIYSQSMAAFWDNDFGSAIQGFQELINSDADNEVTSALADNSQYWLAECYYSQKDFKRAIAEFERVFHYADTDKHDDAQLKIGLSYQSLGNIDKAREEFKRLIDHFPGSEFYPKAKEAFKQLSM